jgi:Multiubiquitin
MAETATAAEAANEKKDKDFTIIINGEPKLVESEVVTYDEVVKLAYPTPPSPDTLFTVTFRNAKKPKEGTLAPGGSVEVKKDGTIFNVKATGKS